MRSLLMTAGALTILCGAALAQTSDSLSNSGAVVDTTSKSQSNSVSNPRVNVYGNPIGNGASSSNSSAASRSNSNSRSGAAASSGQSSSTSGVTVYNNTSSGSTGGSSSTSGGSSGSDQALGTTTGNSGSNNNYTSTQTLRNTPEIVAPSIVGGNPCTVGASGGVSLPGFGIVTGGSWEGKACERRQLAALLYNMGHDIPGAKGEFLQDAAVEVLCVDVAVRQALGRIGQPCVVDRGGPPMTAAPTASMAPAPSIAPKPVASTATGRRNMAAAAPMAAPVAAPSPAAKQYPDWCSTASPEQRRANKSCGG